jgi:hypothetical protein
MTGKAPIVVALCLVTVPVRAEERKVVHDGTEMNLTVSGDDLTIAYGTPPTELREIGVVDGQVLLQGTWTRRDSVLVGTAYAFAPNCPPISYSIRGVVDYNGALVVIGPTPILKFQSCDVASLVWSDGAVMQFAPPAPERKLVEKKRRHAFEEEEKPKPKSKPKPKPRPRIERPAQPSYQQPYYPYQRPWGW